MTDLVDASGVHKSSLYSTFGTKEELFAKCSAATSPAAWTHVRARRSRRARG